MNLSFLSKSSKNYLDLEHFNENPNRLGKWSVASTRNSDVTQILCHMAMRNFRKYKNCHDSNVKESEHNYFEQLWGTIKEHSFDLMSGSFSYRQ